MENKPLSLVETRCRYCKNIYKIKDLHSCPGKVEAKKSFKKLKKDKGHYSGYCGW